MSFDSDVALVGTGLAPLIAASYLINQGKSVLLLNPDFDFFLENSELSLDPALRPLRTPGSRPEDALEELRPFFPGAVEYWLEGTEQKNGYHDPQAPHVRGRSRLWMLDDELLEELYLLASEEGLNPQILEGIPASSRFPGISRPRDFKRGLLVPKLCDVDVPRYRNGVLEFIRERLGSDRVINEASQIELMPGGVRFHWEGVPRTARLNDGVLAFWTPRMTSWILSQAKRFEAKTILPKGLRLWEQWSLVSRDPLDPDVVGVLNEELAVWAETEGAPGPGRKPIHELSVLRAGELLRLDPSGFPEGVSWASRSSFSSLFSLCHEFLQWDGFSVRAMTPRAILEWEGGSPPAPWNLTGQTQIISGCDGPIVDVVKNTRLACERIFSALNS